MANLEIKAFLGWLASDWHVTASSHKQALSVLIKKQT